MLQIIHHHSNRAEHTSTIDSDGLGGDYMIPVCRDEISPRPAGTDLTLRLHVEIKFRRKAGQFSTWHLFRFACNFFEFFFVNMSVYEIENP